jgi:hypothetical protein
MMAAQLLGRELARHSVLDREGHVTRRCARLQSGCSRAIVRSRWLTTRARSP